MHDPSSSCGAPSSGLISADVGGTCARTMHLVTGTFNSAALFVLSYDTLKAQLEVRHTVAAEGPHQFLALGRSASGAQTVYATTWASPSTLSSWHVDAEDYSLRFGNRREITATGSYVHVQPPAYFTLSAPGFGSQPGVARWLGSAGGPTGELHRIDPDSGELGEKVKELIFLPGGQEELKSADKSRKALRYGAHSFDCTPSTNDAGESIEQIAFVADLGANAVQAYSFPQLSHLYTIASANQGDAPRHAIPHPHWPLVFTVTEHSNYLHAYLVPSYHSGPHERQDSAPKLVATADLLPPSSNNQRSNWRADTLRFSSNLEYLFATTRGKSPSTKGSLLAYRLHISNNPQLQVKLSRVAHFETRTSGGKANAIELAPPLHPSPNHHHTDLLILTDDEQGWLDIISFSDTNQSFTVQASTQLPNLESGHFHGASHAIWLL